MELKPYQQCRSAEGWNPVSIRSSSSDMIYLVLVCPWGNPRENICECPGYAYRGQCRHQIDAMDKVCGWTELQVKPDGTPSLEQTAQQRKDKMCPRCGGHTKWALEVVE